MVINNKSVTKTNILIYRFSTRYVRYQLRNSLGRFSNPRIISCFQDYELFPLDLFRVSCLIVSSLSIIINFFCGPCRGLLFFYSSCCLHNCMVVWTFFGIVFLWDWNENWSFPVLWPLLSFPNFLALLFSGIGMKTDLFHFCGHCWVFQIC